MNLPKIARRKPFCFCFFLGKHILIGTIPQIGKSKQIWRATPSRAQAMLKYAISMRVQKICSKLMFV